MIIGEFIYRVLDYLLSKYINMLVKKIGLLLHAWLSRASLILNLKRFIY